MNCELLSSIVWNPPVKIGFVRFYALLWIVGLVIAYFIVRKLYKEQRIRDDHFDPLFIYCFLGILIGARVGHCLIYEAPYYLGSFPHFVEMLLPVKFTGEGFAGARLTGYAGLASHGGTIGLIIALLLYCRKYKIGVMRVLDNIAIATPTTCCAIRLGNLMNSEIIGVPTGSDWGFIFSQVDNLPRHPSQLYEAIAYLMLFFIGWWIYRRKPQRVGTGFYFGFCLTCIFVFRIFVEFSKGGAFRIIGNPDAVNSDRAQWFSIPYALLGIFFLVYSFVHKKTPDNPAIFEKKAKAAKAG